MATTEAQQGPAGAYPVLDYDYTLVESVNAHQAILDELREKHPFFWSTFAQGFWVLTRDEAIRAAYQNPKLFSSSAMVAYEPDPPYLWIPEQLDPPEHTRWRQLLASHFAPAAINQMEGTVRQRCIELIEPFAARGRVDFLAEFARRYPTSIFMELMGLPIGEADKFMHWEEEILHLSSEQDPDRSRGYAAMTAVQAYFGELIEMRRREPRHDLVSAALTWTLEGQPIPTEQLLSFCLLMFMAGLDTVTTQLTYSWWHLATHPDDRRRVSAEPEIIPAAIEELLRAYAFVAPGSQGHAGRRALRMPDEERRHGAAAAVRRDP